MMTFRDLDEIFTAKQAVFDRLCTRTSSLTEVQAAAHPAGGGWSIREILEHVTLVEKQLLQLIPTLIARAGEGAAGDYAVALDPYLGDERYRRIKTRDRYEPTGGVSVSGSLHSLGELQKALIALRPRLARVDPTTVQFPHWVFGPLTLAEWVALIGAHEERHLGQIESILDSPDSPSRTHRSE